MTLEGVKDYAGAKRYYVLATNREPENPETWYDLGAFYFRQKQWWPSWVALNRSYGLDAFGPAGEKGGLLDQVRCKPGVEPTSRQCPARAPGASP